MSSTESCCVSSQNCLYPAGYIMGNTVIEMDYSEGDGADKECFACGEPVCENCSQVVPYYDYGRKRICFNCMKEHEIKLEIYKIELYDN